MLGQLDHMTEEDFGALAELEKQGKLTDAHRGMRIDVPIERQGVQCL